MPTYWYRRVPNLGDQLSPVVLEWVSNSRPIWVSPRFAGKVLAVGSILESLMQYDVVWGAGLIRDEPVKPPADVLFLSVRGPLTRERLAADVPEVYGDPVLLLPLFHRHPIAKKYSVGVVPHYVDHELIEIDDPEVRVIDIREHWAAVVDQIRGCDVIISSSLHGLIVAEAYGIPAAWVRVSDNVLGGTFKFNDYYLSTGRDAREPSSWAGGIDQAIKRVAPPLGFDSGPLLDAASGLMNGSFSG